MGEEVNPLTSRQREVLDVIAGFIRDHGYPPTYSDLGAALGMTFRGAHDHVLRLEKKGCLEIDRTKSRTLKLRETAAFYTVGSDGLTYAGREIAGVVRGVS